MKWSINDHQYYPSLKFHQTVKVPICCILLSTQWLAAFVDWWSIHCCRHGPPMTALSTQGQTQFCRSWPDHPFKLKYTPPISRCFTVFSWPTLSHHKPIANNVKIKEFIEVQWEQKQTLLKAPGLWQQRQQRSLMGLAECFGIQSSDCWLHC